MKKTIKNWFSPKTRGQIQQMLIRWKHASRMRAFQQDTFPHMASLKCEIGYNSYGAYCVPLSSKYRPAAQKILSHDVYEPETIAFMRNRCQKGDIIHAGTYFGDFLPGIANACTGKVWAFEPNPENHHCAQVTILLNRLQNVNLYHAGLASDNGHSFIQTRDENGNALGGSSHLLSREQDGSESQSVELLSIDHVVPTERNISILQLDVEGHEEAALKGAIHTIHRCKPILILEIIPQSTFLQGTWFAENILQFGYQETRTLHGNRVFEIPSATDSDRS